jgi:predicted kinase
MQKVLILSGISGSGKSTFAKQFCVENPTYLRINRDEIRKSILPITLNEYWQKDKEYQQKIESIVQSLHENAISSVLKRKWDLVIDNTHLKVSYLNDLVKSLSNFEVEISFKLIETDIEECISRDKQRFDVVGEVFIRKQAEKLAMLRKHFNFKQIIISKPNEIQYDITNQNHVKYDETLPKCVLVDIDGTVAEKANRSPFEWLRVGEDTPKPNVIRLVQSLKKVGYEIIFFSGRDAICYSQTTKWLCLHFNWQVNDFQLFMRVEKDMRKDSIIKKELFNEHILGKYFVDFVVDDRNQVVEMWRKELNLTCLQVEYGDF